MGGVGRRLGALVIRRRVVAYSAIMLLVVVAETAFIYIAGPGLLDWFGQIKGTDFIQFYAAGRLILEGRGSELYVFEPPFGFPAQFEVEARILAPQVTEHRHAFVVPPYYALPFVPLALLPYLLALALWIALNVALLVATLRLLRPHVRLLQAGGHPGQAPAGRIPYLVALSFFPFLECQLDGQNSVVTLALVAAAYVALRDRRDVLAGAILGLGLYKPQLVLTIVLLLLIARRWRVALGFAGAGALVVGLSWALVGTKGMLDYAALSATMPGWIHIPGWKTWNMHSWHSFFVLLARDPGAASALSAVATLATLGLLVAAWWPMGRECRRPLIPRGEARHSSEGRSPDPGFGASATMRIKSSDAGHGPNPPAPFPTGEGGVERCRTGLSGPDRASWPVRSVPRAVCGSDCAAIVTAPSPFPTGEGGQRGLGLPGHPLSLMPFDLQYALAVIGTLLVSPHVFVYDLTLLVLPGLLLADRLLGDPELAASDRGGWLKVLLALAYFVPLVSRFAAKGIGLQVSVLVVAGLFAVTYHLLAERRRAATATQPALAGRLD